MYQGLAGRDPLVRVEAEHLSDEVLRLRVHLRADVGPGPGRGRAEVGSGDGGLLRPVLLRGGAHDVKDLLQLVHLVLAGEERLAQEELGKDAPAGPDVHWCCIGQAHQHLGTPVPECYHLER